MKISMRKFINYIALKQLTHTLLKQILVRISPSLAYYELSKDVCYLLVDLLVARYTLRSSKQECTTEDSQTLESLTDIIEIIYEGANTHGN